MDKKEKIKVLENHFGVKAKYQGVPSFAYQIDAGEDIYTIARDGTILDSAGRSVELSAIRGNQNPQGEEARLTQNSQAFEVVEITLPLTGHTVISLKNLINMLYSKQVLIQKALGLKEKLIEVDLVDKLSETIPETVEDFRSLLLEVGQDKCPGLYVDFEQGLLTFKFNLTGPDEIKAVSDLIGLMNISAQKQKHVSSRTKDTDNPKYAFRTWLLRLGMIGDEFKHTRKTLLANLEGNGAFRRPQEGAEAI